MASRAIRVEELSAEERIELMGRLWDSLDPTAAASMIPELAAEVDRREAEADVAPEAGDTWPDIQSALLRTLR